MMHVQSVPSAARWQPTVRQPALKLGTDERLTLMRLNFLSVSGHEQGYAQNYAATPVAYAPPSSVQTAERRGPNRAKNVTRPNFKEKVQTAAAPKKTGTDDEWTSF